MAEKLTNNSTDSEGLDLREFLKILNGSKKLIILNILIFTIASIVYSNSLKPSFETSAILEIGFLIDKGNIELIEEPPELFSDLRTLVLKNPDNKFNQEFSMNLLEKKTIVLKTTSNSKEKNKSLLTEIINYVFDRHSKIAISTKLQNNDLLIQKINEIEAEITHYNAKLSDQNQSKYLDIISNLDNKNQSIQQLNLLTRNAKDKDKLFTLNQKLEFFINELEANNSQSTIQTQIIQKINTNTIKPKNLLIIFIGIVFGLVTSVFLVLIIRFIKIYRNGQA